MLLLHQMGCLFRVNENYQTFPSNLSYFFQKKDGEICGFLNILIQENVKMRKPNDIRYNS